MPGVEIISFQIFFHLERDRTMPAAEYWLGAHPGGITEVEVETNKWISLADAIDAFKYHWLGEKVAEQFGRLPFLLKVLDVKRYVVHSSPSQQTSR